MYQQSFTLSLHRIAQSRLIRRVGTMLALVLCLQLVLASQHHHDIAEISPDCISCVLSAHVPTAPPPPLVLGLVSVALLWFIVDLRVPLSNTLRTTYILPLAHAPPADYV